MRKQGLSRQQRREARQRQGHTAYAANVAFKLPPGMSQEQFNAIAAREWASITGGDGVVLVDGKEVPSEQ